MTLAYKLFVSCAIAAAYPTRSGWIRMNASSFRPLPCVLTLMQRHFSVFLYTLYYLRGLK